MTADTIQSLLIEIAYATRQLRKHADIQRALDSLERVESTLREYITPSEERGYPATGPYVCVQRVTT